MMSYKIAIAGTFTPNIVYHLGEYYSRVEQSFDNIEKVWKYNKDGIFAVLEFIRKTGCKILYTGSSTKFCDGGMGRNASPYAWIKATNRELVMTAKTEALAWSLRRRLEDYINKCKNKWR